MLRAERVGDRRRPDPSRRNVAGMPSTVSDAEPGREHGGGDHVQRQAAPGDGVVGRVLHAHRGPQADADRNDPVDDDEPEQHVSDARTAWTETVTPAYYTMRYAPARFGTRQRTLYSSADCNGDESHCDRRQQGRLPAILERQLAQVQREPLVRALRAGSDARGAGSAAAACPSTAPRRCTCARARASRSARTSSARGKAWRSPTGRGRDRAGGRGPRC